MGSRTAQGRTRDTENGPEQPVGNVAVVTQPTNGDKVYHESWLLDDVPLYLRCQGTTLASHLTLTASQGDAQCGIDSCCEICRGAIPLRLHHPIPHFTRDQQWTANLKHPERAADRIQGFVTAVTG